MNDSSPNPPSPVPGSGGKPWVTWVLGGVCLVLLLVVTGLVSVLGWISTHPAPPATPRTAPQAVPAEARAELKPPTPADVIGRVKQSVVLVQVEGPDGVGSGSGFPIDEERVATCAHVIADASSVSVVAADGTQIPATVVITDRLRDIAVLKCGPGLPPPLELGDPSEVREGEEVAVTGYPVVSKLLELGYHPVASTSRGTLSATRMRETEAGDIEELQTDAAVNPGNSGGPLYSLADGKILGLVSTKLRDEAGIGFASSVSGLRQLLGPRFQSKGAQTTHKAPKSLILFAVDAEGMLDTVLLLKNGKYISPTHPSLDGKTPASASFGAAYFTPGRTYSVIFGGAPAGSVRVTDRPEPGAGVTFMAQGQLETSAPIRGQIQGLATDAPAIAAPACTRRAATEVERAAALRAADATFRKRGISAGLRKQVAVRNLTAGDLDADGKCELMGSFQITDGGREHNVFILLEPRGESFSTAMVQYHPGKDPYGVDREDQRLLDWVDLDGDGVSEVVTVSSFYEWWEYKVYSRKSRNWREVHHSHGGGA